MSRYALSWHVHESIIAMTKISSVLRYVQLILFLEAILYLCVKYHESIAIFSYNTITNR